VSTPGLSAVAAFVLRSLQDHPELRFPEAIAREAESYDAQAISDALAELERLGLAEEEPGRGWRATGAAQPA
jgi:hypothetical protein